MSAHNSRQQQHKMLVIPCDCGCNSNNNKYDVKYYPVPARREFRTRMKRQTLRKQTAVQRIEMNRFWNELEEVFDRLEDVRTEVKVDNIEEAENVLNETLECDREVETVFANGLSLQYSCWCQKPHDIPDNDDDGDVSGYSSHFEDEDEDEYEGSGQEDDSLLTSPCSYFSYEADLELPLPPPLDKTLSSLRQLSLIEI